MSAATVYPMRPREMVVILTVLAGPLVSGCGSDEPQTTATQSAAPEPVATADEWPDPKSDHGDSEGFLVDCVADYAAAKTRFNFAKNEYKSTTGKEWSVDGARRKASTNEETDDDRVVVKAYVRPWKVVLKYPDCFQARDVKEARRVTTDLS